VPPSTDAAQWPASAPHVDHADPALATPEIGDVGVYIARRLTALVFDIFGAGFSRRSRRVRGGDRSAQWASTAPNLGLSTLCSGPRWVRPFCCTSSSRKVCSGRRSAKVSSVLGVVRTDGRPNRNGARAHPQLDQALDLCGIGFALATVTSRRQGLGDFVRPVRGVANSRMGRSRRSWPWPGRAAVSVGRIRLGRLARRRVAAARAARARPSRSP